MAGYCTLVLYFHSPAARENTTAHSCNIQPYCPLTHQIIYIYIHVLSNTFSLFYATLSLKVGRGGLLERSNSLYYSPSSTCEVDSIDGWYSYLED